MLAALARAGIKHLAMEASSHGLDQRRLDGVRLAVAGFTNLTRDHLDYHGDMAAYRAAKLRLFNTLLPMGGAGAFSTEADEETQGRLRAIAAARGLRLLSVGASGDDIRLESATPLPDGQGLALRIFGRAHALHLPLPGRFQADNALLAAALAILAGRDEAAVLEALPRLAGVRGRMELAGRTTQGAAAYVDYAHTPDALERLLAALRPHTHGRLICVFGAGGDRDPGKRPLMGAVVAAGADIAIITDDNPRGEDPAAIRAAIRAAAPDAMEIGDRRAAIAEGVAMLRAGDVLVVALNSDDSVRRLKGDDRPVFPLEQRMEVMAALECVDLVTWFEERTAHEVIRATHPTIYVKGGDYARPEDVTEFALLQELGVELRLLGHIPGVSTTAAIHRMRSRETGILGG
jgi:UDP-N-acetylmuramoyl-L-alanyl-D-glutamate--2,6-diaminopimelate ligase